MGHDHHEPPYVIPCYKQFTVKGIKELENLERELAKKGLKDPWIRNEAWRYNPKFGSKGKRALNFFFRGFPLGLALTLITLGVDKFVLGGNGHGHGHGGDKDH